MDRLINMKDARIYVTTEAIYANDEYFGKWMFLSDYESKKEFVTAFRFLHSNEDEPVLLILCWQDIPKPLVSMHGISSKIFKLISLMSGFDNHQSKAFHLWLDQQGPDIFGYKSGEIIRLFENSYQGYYEKAEVFGRYYAKEYLAIANPDFDYALFGRQLLENQFIQIEGYVFKIIAIN